MSGIKSRFAVGIRVVIRDSEWLIKHVYIGVLPCVYLGKRVDNMEGGDDEKTEDAALRHGPHPIIHKADSVRDECDWMIKEIQALRRGERAYADSEIWITVHTYD